VRWSDLGSLKESFLGVAYCLSINLSLR
jgi:hypothetical protein